MARPAVVTRWFVRIFVNGPPLRHMVLPVVYAARNQVRPNHICASRTIVVPNKQLFQHGLVCKNFVSRSYFPKYLYWFLLSTPNFKIHVKIRLLPEKNWWELFSDWEKRPFMIGVLQFLPWQSEPPSCPAAQWRASPYRAASCLC